MKNAPPIKIVTVFDDADDNVGIVYTINQHQQGRPELVAINVPKIKIGCVMTDMSYLATRVLQDGQTVCATLELVIRAITGEKKKGLLEMIMSECHPQSKVMLLMPRYGSINDVERWGCLPAAPDGQDTLAKEILIKLRSRTRSFCRFIDGNTFNSSALNVLPVSLQQALVFPDWIVDWGLSPKEFTYLDQNRVYFLQVTRRPKLM